MPSPVLIGRRFYLRVRVPHDLLAQARGRTIQLPVAGVWRPVKVGSDVKVSLETMEAAAAKSRFGETYAALLANWEGMRSGPKPLTHKQMLAIAGEVRKIFVEAFDDDPGTTHRWLGILRSNFLAANGNSNRLKIPIAGGGFSDVEQRFGPFTDLKLAQKGLSIPSDQRSALLSLVVAAMDEAAVINLRKADGDYSDSGETKKYPVFVDAITRPIRSQSHKAVATAITFTSVIDEEVRGRSAGKNAVPMRDKSEKKYRTAVEAFELFRQSGDATSVTAREVDSWKQAMLEAGKLSNNTIGQRIQNLRTVIQWAQRHSYGELYPNGNPVDIVGRPAFQTVASTDRTFTMEEAAMTLLASREEVAAELRWLPWMSAYSGARINELAQLTPADFFKVNEDWFFRLTTAGGKTLKTKFSERTVPLHPALLAEGLIDFVESQSDRQARMFHVWSTQAISRWLKKKVGLTRKGLAPNHGWRHLFEDLCINGSLTDAARNYITGRATGKSSEGYGKSQAMLPGLATEMRKIPTIRLDVKRAT